MVFCETLVRPSLATMSEMPMTEAEDPVPLALAVVPKCLMVLPVIVLTPPVDRMPAIILLVVDVEGR